MHEEKLYRARILASVASVMIGLAAGSNYGYSAWGPQFADRLRLSATEGNLLSGAGNLGMYAFGIPIGIFVDSRGPRPAIFMGALLLGLGYYALHQAYANAACHVLLLCLYGFMTGLGSCMVFNSTLKVAAANWPHHRGTATGIPLAALGLSAFFWSTCGYLYFPGDVGAFLGLLTYGTSVLALAGCFFLRVVPGGQSEPAPMPADSTACGSPTGLLRRKSTDDSRRPSSGPKRGPVPPEVDVRGLQLLREPEFWRLFVILGIIAGIGLMTINNIGNNATALWRYYQVSADDAFLLSRQRLHVSVLSLGSFSGRLLSGLGSDFLVRVLNVHRIWCIVVAALVFALAQVLALTIVDPHYLVLVSSLSGLGYGLCFGVFPSIIAETFGVAFFAQNWGVMNLAFIFSGYMFNIFYGAVYDSHSVVGPHGDRSCSVGPDCYRSAYVFTLGASVLGLACTLWDIRHRHKAGVAAERAKTFD